MSKKEELAKRKMLSEFNLQITISSQSVSRFTMGSFQEERKISAKVYSDNEAFVDLYTESDSYQGAFDSIMKRIDAQLMTTETYKKYQKAEEEKAQKKAEKKAKKTEEK